MKFREYDNLVPKVVFANEARDLEKALEQLSEQYDFVDLQYAESTARFSALALLKKKEEA